MIIIKIGIIDSGLGGISVLNELINQRKYANYVLFLDYKFNPFGEKSEEELLNRLHKAIKFLKDKGCNQIVIACNTLSVVALRNNIKDVITPIYFFKKELITNFDDDSILLATDFTINSNIYNYKGMPFSKLVRYIEGNNSENIDTLLNNIKKYNKVFLGCTHFNLIKNKLKNVKIFDSGTILANNLEVSNSILNVKIYITKTNKNIKNHLLKHLHINQFVIKCINI